MAKNRFTLDGSEEARFLSAEEELLRDEDVEYSGETIYVDEPDHRQRRSYFGLFIWLGIVLVLLAGAGWYGYAHFYASDAAPNSIEDVTFPEVDERLQDRYYVPRGDFPGELQRGVDLFYDRDYANAERTLKKYIQDEADEPMLMAIGQIYLGAIALDRDELELARYYFVQALQNDPKSVPALVNLAITHRRLNEHEDARKYAEEAYDLAPEDQRVALLLGNILSENQEVDRALEVYEDAIAEEGRDPLLYYNSALNLLRRERYDEAIMNFSKAIEAAGTGSIAIQSHSHLGQIYFRRGNLELATHHIEQSIKFAPNNGKYHYNLGVVLMRMNQEERALRSFRRALDAGTDDARVYRAIATALEQMGDDRLATRALQNALHLNPNDLTAMFRLGDLYYKLRQLREAEDVYASIANKTQGDENTEAAYYKLALVYSEMEDYNRAIDMLERAARLNNQNPRTYYLLGRVYEQAGKQEFAAQAYKRALDLGPGLVRNEERQVRMALAELYRRQGGHELALKEYRLIMDLNRQEPQILQDPELDMAIGGTYFALRDYANAIASFEKVSESSNASADQRKDAYLKIAMAYSAMGSRESIERARNNINRAVRMAPLDYEAQIIQASILMKTGSVVDREKAIEILKAVTSSDVDARTASSAYNYLGSAYMKNNEHRRAMDAFDRALELDPGNTEAYNNRRVARNELDRSF